MPHVKRNGRQIPSPLRGIEVALEDRVGFFSLGNKGRVVVRTHRRQELTRVGLPQAEPSFQ